MSIVPPMKKMPSEHTVEVLASHYLLHHINRSRCWLYCPTTNEELKRGYDVGTQGFKSILIQYKGLVYASKTSASIDIDQTQQSTLLSNFPKLNSPYAFYGFCAHRSYEEISKGYNSISSPVFFGSCVFVDVHSLPAHTSRLRYSFKHDEVFPVVSGKAGASIPHVTGPALACAITACHIGDRHLEQGAVESRRNPARDRKVSEESERLFSLSVLRVPIG